MSDLARQYGSITLAGQSGGQGVLRITEAGFAWKARESGRNITVATAEIANVYWLRGGRGYQIKLSRKGGSYVKFEGFRNSDLQDLQTFLKQAISKDLELAKQAVRGWSWGQLDVTDGGAASLVFKAGGGTHEPHKAKTFEDAFDLPLGMVSNVQLPNHNEIAIDLHVDDTAGKNDEELVEMRFFVPDASDAADVHDRIKARADTSAFAGESISSFTHMGVVVPRGRFDIDLYPNHIKLRGKTVDFKILYSSITRLFLLPKPDNMLVSFVMSLDPPIRQGNTMYPHIVFQFDTEEQVSSNLQLPQEELLKKYDGKLKAVEEGFTWRVFSKLVKHLSRTPLHVPKSFRTSRGGSAVRTALGSDEGFLFFLESCCFFVNKPPTYIRYDDIDFVEFRRMDLERRFDLFMSLTTGSGRTLTFTNIDRTEFDVIFKFLYDSKNVPVENADHLKRTGGRARVEIVDDDDDSESEDEDFDPTAKNTPKRSADADIDADEEVVSAGESSDSDDDKYIPLDEAELTDMKASKKKGSSAGDDRPAKRTRK